MTTKDNLSSHFQQGKRSLPPVADVTFHSDLVTSVLGQNPGSFTLNGTNTYIVGNGESRFLIDTGEGKSNYIPLLQQTLTKIGCKKLCGIIITHWHHDHVGGVPSVLEAFGEIPVYKFIPELEEVAFGDKEGSISPYTFHAKEKFIPLKDGEILTCEGATLKVIFTPGHANDHICLFLEEERNLFSGDNVLGVGTGVFRNLSEYLSSLEIMKSLQPKVLYSAHGPLITNAVEKIEEYISHRQTRVDQVKSILKSSSGKISSEEITRKIYIDIPETLMKPAQWNTERVLEHLENIGLASKDSSQNSSEVLWISQL